MIKCPFTFFTIPAQVLVVKKQFPLSLDQGDRTIQKDDSVRGQCGRRASTRPLLSRDFVEGTGVRVREGRRLLGRRLEVYPGCGRRREDWTTSLDPWRVYSGGWSSDVINPMTWTDQWEVMWFSEIFCLRHTKVETVGSWIVSRAVPLFTSFIRTTSLF